MASRTRGRLDARTPKARQLRCDATPFERKLWAALKQLELPQGHFRRQAPIGPYFADFAHHGLRLVVELDGAQHGLDDGLRHDGVRTAYLEAAGYRVIRFWNNEVREDLDAIVETILAALAEAPPTPRPSPPLASRAGEGIWMRRASMRSMELCDAEPPRATHVHQLGSGPWRCRSGRRHGRRGRTPAR